MEALLSLKSASGMEQRFGVQHVVALCSIFGIFSVAAAILKF